MNGFPLTIRKQPSGETFWIHVEPNYRVCTCKQKIQRMRGIPACNIRLAIANSRVSEIDHDEEEKEEKSSDDEFQQRTLDSLGLSGGPILDIIPITLYIRTPTGRLIKFKDAIDVETSVDRLEKLVAAKLGSLNLMEGSDFSKERFRLYHDRLPMRRGTPITKYKVKHMDILRIKFGTDESESSQREKRREASRKSEAHQQKQQVRKTTLVRRRSESETRSRKAGNSNMKSRALSSSPHRGSQRKNSPARKDISSARRRLATNRTRSESESVKERQSRRKNNMKKSSSEQNLERLSQSLSNVRSSSASPARSRRTSEEEPSLRRKLKASRRASDVSRTSLSRSSRSSNIRKPTKKIDDEISERRRQFNLRKKPEGDDAAGRQRSRSNTAVARRNSSRSKSRGGSDKNSGQDQKPEVQRRRSIRSNTPKKVEQQKRRSRSASKVNPDLEPVDRRPRGRNRNPPQSVNKSNPEVEAMDRKPRSRSNIEMNRNKNSSKTVDRRPRSRSNDDRKPNRNPPEARKEVTKQRGGRSRSLSNKRSAQDKPDPVRRSGSDKSNLSTRRTRDRSDSIDPTKKRMEEGHPRKLCHPSDDPNKKRVEEGHPRKFCHPSPSNSKKSVKSKKESKKNDIPNSISINLDHDDGNDESAITPTGIEEKGPALASPTSVTMSIQQDDYSEGSSDIRSLETELMMFAEEEIDKNVSTSKEISQFPPSKTKYDRLINMEVSTSHREDDPVVVPVDRKLRTNARGRKAKTSKNTFKAKRVSLRELKAAKAKEQLSSTAGIGNSNDNRDATLTTVGTGQTSIQESLTVEMPIEETIKNTLRELKERPENTTTRAAKTYSKAKEKPPKSQLVPSMDSFSTASFSDFVMDGRAGTSEESRPKLRKMKRTVSPRTEKASSAPTKKLPKEVVANAKNTLEEAKPISESKHMVQQTENRSVLRIAKATFEKGDCSTQPKNPEKERRDKKRPVSPRDVANKAKFDIVKDSSFEIAVAPLESPETTENSVVRLAKAKFEIGDTATQSTRPQKQRDEKRPVSPSSDKAISKAQSGKDSPKLVASKTTAPQKQKEKISLVQQAKAKFENIKSFVKLKEPTKQQMNDKHPETELFRQRRIDSIGPSEQVIEELKETLGIEEEKISLVETTKPEKCAAKTNVQGTANGAFQAAMGTSIRPIRPSLKDTPSNRAQADNSFANAAAEANAYLERSIANVSEGDTPKGEESSSNVAAKKELTTERSVKLQAKIDQTGATESKPLPSSQMDDPTSVKDRIRRFSYDKADKMSAGSGITVTNLIETDNAENKSPNSFKNRIQKFQNTGKENADSTAFQMSCLQYLGLAASKDEPPADSRHSSFVSTTYSFLCSNDEESQHEDGNFSHTDDDSSIEDSTTEEYESIHVIGPDLIPIEIPIYSDSERLGTIKEVVAEASGIPADELRLAMQQSEDSDIEESRRITLDDDYKLSPGDILAVQPSTVVVKLPDGGSKLELSVFPGTNISDIKEYIAESTGTDPSRQLIYDFEKNFNDEIRDEIPISTDCILRLTVY